MKMYRILAAMAATAISATSFAAMSISSASAADALGVAYIGGGLGAEQRWNAADQEAAGSTVATVDGNAQYEVTWKVPENGGTDTVQFLAVMIKPADGVDNFNIDTFPNLSLSVDEVWIDGTKLDYTASADAINTNYYENGEGYSRIYLTNDWVEPKIYDLPMATNITQEVKVVFTVSGLDTDGTSNVTKNEPSTTTTVADSTVQLQQQQVAMTRQQQPQLRAETRQQQPQLRAEIRKLRPQHLRAETRQQQPQLSRAMLLPLVQVTSV